MTYSAVAIYVLVSSLSESLWWKRPWTGDGFPVSYRRKKRFSKFKILQLRHKTHLSQESRVYFAFAPQCYIFIPFVLFQLSAADELLLPCKSPSSFLVASSRIRPIKVALFHLHGNSRHCRQQASLGLNKKTKLSARRSHFGGQNSVQGLLIISAQSLSIHLQLWSRTAPSLWIFDPFSPCLTREVAWLMHGLFFFILWCNSYLCCTSRRSSA